MLPDDDLIRLVCTAVAQSRLGDRAASDSSFKNLRDRFGSACNFQYAGVHAQRGETSEALAALEEAWRVRDAGLLYLPSDPFFDPIRTEPRFKSLETKLDFSKATLPLN